jgi:hypothetical protein
VHRFRLSSAARRSVARLSAAALLAAADSSSFCRGASLKPALQLHLPHYYRWAQRYSTFRHPVASVFFQIARTPHATNTSIDRAYLGSPPPLCVLSPMAKATDPARRSALSWVGFEISVVPSIHRATTTARATSCPTNGCAIRFDRRGPAIPPLVLSVGARGGNRGQEVAGSSDGSEQQQQCRSTIRNIRHESAAFFLCRTVRIRTERAGGCSAYFEALRVFAFAKADIHTNQTLGELTCKICCEPVTGLAPVHGRSCIHNLL